MKKFLMSLLFGIVMLMAMMPTRVSAGDTVIEALNINCSVEKVTAGALPNFTETLTLGPEDQVYIDYYYPNTGWAKTVPNNPGWSGFDLTTPIAEKDNTTRYALKLCVNQNPGYVITTSTQVYYNGDLKSDATVDIKPEWGAFVYIDLGLATDPDSGYRTVSFDNKGHGSKPSDQSIPYESTAEAPDEPFERGWYFEGWYEEASTTPFNFETPITSDVKLYAKWCEAELIPALHITGSVTTLTPGTLDRIDAKTDPSDNATIEEPPYNTYWLKHDKGTWYCHKDDNPYTPTSKEGTRYAMNLCVNVDPGYQISESTKVFYNGIEYPIDANRLNNWGAYVIIDLGIARYPATGVTLSKTSTTLKINETDTLRAIVSPDNATEKSVKWASDNINVAKVDDYGKITAVAAGTATITVTTVDGNFTATCKVTVPKQPDPKPDPEPTSTPEPKRGEVPFTDLAPNAWYTRYVKYVYENRIMNGTNGGTTFEPNTPCSRAMFVTTLYNAEGQESVDMDLPFDDVPQKSWYRNSVKWALKNEITKGISATKFGGNDNVSREQVATFLANYAKHKGYDTSASTELDKYPDAGKVSGWAKEPIKWANAIGIVNGKLKDGTTLLDPKANATRAEVATMIVNFLEYYK